MSKTTCSALTSFLLFVPLLAAAATLTDADIDKFIRAVPVTAPALDTMKSKIERDDALGKSMTLAQMDGRLHRELIKLTAAWPEQTQLADQVKNEGFDSVDEWALVADRITAVIASAQWVVAAASMPTPGSDQATLDADTNLFDYLQDDANDASLRSKYRQQLAEMCERMCFDTSDLPAVSKRYKDINAALENQ